MRAGRLRCTNGRGLPFYFLSRLDGSISIGLFVLLRDPEVCHDFIHVQDEKLERLA